MKCDRSYEHNRTYVSIGKTVIFRIDERNNVQIYAHFFVYYAQE